MRSEFSISIGVGLCRDLRGVVRTCSSPCSSLRPCITEVLLEATCNKKSYALLFEWLFPARWHVLLRLVENCWDLPSVVVPFFRFLAELVLNKSQRITFDICSPNGLLLFKEASKCLEVYGCNFFVFVVALTPLVQGPEFYRLRTLLFLIFTRTVISPCLFAF